MGYAATAALSQSKRRNTSLIVDRDKQRENTAVKVPEVAREHFCDAE